MVDSSAMAKLDVRIRLCFNAKVRRRLDEVSSDLHYKLSVLIPLPIGRRGYLSKPDGLDTRRVAGFASRIVHRSCLRWNRGTGRTQTEHGKKSKESRGAALRVGSYEHELQGHGHKVTCFAQKRVISRVIIDRVEQSEEAGL
jgi:hypothetical protein